MRVKGCANCGGHVPPRALKELTVGPHAYCSPRCRNEHLPREHVRLRAAATYALAHTRSSHANGILVAGLTGTFELEGAK